MHYFLYEVVYFYAWYEHLMEFFTMIMYYNNNKIIIIFLDIQITLLKSYKKLHTKLQWSIHKKKTPISIQRSCKTALQFKIPRNLTEL